MKKLRKTFTELTNTETGKVEKHYWDDPNQFHGEAPDGTCALCHSNWEQCAFCKAHE